MTTPQDNLSDIAAFTAGGARVIIAAGAGAGKTTLLARLVAEAEAAGAMVGYINWARLRRQMPRLAFAPANTPHDILDALHAVLPRVCNVPQADIDASFAGYVRARDRRVGVEERVLDAQRRLGHLPSAVAGSYRAVRAMPPEALIRLCRFWFSLPERVQNAPDAAAFLKTGLESIITLNAANVGQLRAFIADHLRPALGADDTALFADPDAVLADQFAAGLTALAATRRIALFFDDYQAIALSPAHRVLFAVLAAPVSVVIAGSGINDAGWDALMLSPGFVGAKGEAIDAGPQTRRDDWAAFYTGAGYTDMSGALGGQDLLLAQLGGPTLATAVARLVEETITDAEMRRQLYALALARWPDPMLLSRLARRDFVPRPNLNRFSAQPPVVQAEAILAESAGAEQTLTAYAGLRMAHPVLFEVQLPMRGLEDTLTLELHPAVRESLRAYLRVERRRFSLPVQEEVLEPARNIAQLALDAREADAIGVALAERARDTAWQTATLDVAYYRLWLDEAVGWVFIMPRYLLGLAYAADLARGLAAVGEALAATYYNEGVELLPIVRELAGAAGGESEVGGAGEAGHTLDARLAGLDSLEQLGVAARGRWYKQENLGQRTGAAGSEEAEVRGIIFWQMGRAHAAAGRFDRAVQLYEQTLGMNVVMPELRREAARAHLRLAERLVLTGGSGGSGRTGFDPTDALAGAQRAAALYPDYAPATSEVAFLALGLAQYELALSSAAQAAGDLYAPLYAAAALVALNRSDEAEAQAHAFRVAASDAYTRATGQAIFDALIETQTAIAATPPDTVIVERVRAALHGQSAKT